MLGQDFDRDGALEPRVASAIDFAHPSRAQRRLNLVGSQFRARGEGHNARIIAPLWVRFLPSHSGGSKSTLPSGPSTSERHLARPGIGESILSALHLNMDQISQTGASM